LNYQFVVAETHKFGGSLLCGSKQNAYKTEK